MLPGQARKKQRWNLRFIGKWFIPGLRQIGDHRADRRRRQAKLGVFGAEMPRDFGRVRRLIIFGVVKADGEGANGARRLHLHECHDR